MNCRITRALIAAIGFGLAADRIWADSAPVVSNVTVSQRQDGSMLVDVFYDLADADGDACTVGVLASDDGGATWAVPITAVSGDMGMGITPGTGKHIVWDCATDLPGAFGGPYTVQVCADDGFSPVPSGMALIPAGQFQMGDTFNEGSTAERPVHAVYVDAFYMETYEVTNQQYAAALNWAKSQNNLITVTNGVVYKYDSGTSYPYCSTTSAPSGLPDYGTSSRITWNGSTFDVVPGKGNHPMVLVSWYGSVAYANWRSAIQSKPLCYDLSAWTCNFGNGYRLPTEAEWEKAARGGVAGHRFPWSDTDTIQHARANYYSSTSHSYDNSPTRGFHPAFNTGAIPYTSPVGYFAPNGYGLYDMAGNVWNWCNDWYSSTYYQDYVNAGSPPNPHGPASGMEHYPRVKRGGRWNYYANECRVAYRNGYSPGSRDYWNGFRLALDANSVVPPVCEYSAAFTIDNREHDCNDNGLPDRDDIANCDGSAWCGDCNTNGVPDECDLAAGKSEDCNSNGAPDECDINTAMSADCNVDGQLDVCQLDHWTQRIKLVPADLATNDAFGSAIALRGRLMVAGSNHHAGGLSRGAAYVFERTNAPFDQWIHRATLVANDAMNSDNLGSAVAMDGNTILVGAMEDDTAAGTDAGSAYIFEIDPLNGYAWTQRAKLVANDGKTNDFFGSEVALSGDTALVYAWGSQYGGQVSTGSIYVFVRSGPPGSSVWTQQAKLIAADAAIGDSFGASIAVRDDLAIIGAPAHDHLGMSDAGAAYIFVRTGEPGTEVWTQAGKVVAMDSAAGDRFGISVGLQGKTLVVGAFGDDVANVADTGSVYVFVHEEGAPAWEWVQQAKLFAADLTANTGFGASVAVDADTVVVGAPCDDHSGEVNAGSAYVFALSGALGAEEWTQQAKLLPGDPGHDDFFGVCAISGDTVIVGSPLHDGDEGAVFVYRIGRDCNESGGLDECDIAQGTSVDLNENSLPDECDLSGDLDGDGSVGLADYLLLSDCISGPGVEASPPICAPGLFTLGDLDRDGDVDLEDLAQFARRFGPASS